jgi:GNAT superfamily N-acetyltransferase
MLPARGVAAVASAAARTTSISSEDSVIFSALYESSCKGELLLSEGGMCHFHLRKDGFVTIKTIIVSPEHQNQGIGKRLVWRAIGNAVGAFVSCPADLPSNDFWEHIGFKLSKTTKSKSGREINLWIWTKS